VSSRSRRPAESGVALRAVFQNPALRRLELAWAGSTMGVWLSTVGLGVYAFEAGGASAVGVLGHGRHLTGLLGPALGGLLFAAARPPAEENQRPPRLVGNQSNQGGAR
jgi:hypothetical protein